MMGFAALPLRSTHPTSYELLGFGLRTDGSVHVHQIKSLDWTARKASFVEKVPDVIVRQVLDCLAAVLEDD